jgi:acid phosphatase (class A)
MPLRSNPFCAAYRTQRQPQEVPEKSAQLFARGREYGRERVIGGDHFPTDVEAGRLAATAIAASLFQTPSFTTDFADAKAELRQVLGLPPQ